MTRGQPYYTLGRNLSIICAFPETSCVAEFKDDRLNYLVAKIQGTIVFRLWHGSYCLLLARFTMMIRSKYHSEKFGTLAVSPGKERVLKVLPRRVHLQ
jgi:hypothetical protein